MSKNHNETYIKTKDDSLRNQKAKMPKKPLPQPKDYEEIEY
ncbi:MULTISPECIES: hypothetical protein [Heyndrickxia]|nr:hypothetical protein [Heyndrickxia oleronia]MEC1374210.1 hypothetical protein [Heyndrickxia oleronia]